MTQEKNGYQMPKNPAAWCANHLTHDNPPNSEIKRLNSVGVPS